MFVSTGKEIKQEKGKELIKEREAGRKKEKEPPERALY